VIGGCAVAKMSPALPRLKSELGLTLRQAGWLARLDLQCACHAQRNLWIDADLLLAQLFRHPQPKSVRSTGKILLLQLT
jgi:hypothetical protein